MNECLLDQNTSSINISSQKVHKLCEILVKLVHIWGTRFLYKNAELLGSVGYVFNCLDLQKSVHTMFLIFIFNHTTRCILIITFRCCLLSGCVAQSTLKAHFTTIYHFRSKESLFQDQLKPSRLFGWSLFWIEMS